MKYLKTYKIYKESLLIDILESLNIWHDVLLSSIDAKEVDIYDTYPLSFIELVKLKYNYLI